MYRYDKNRIKIKKIFMSLVLLASISVGSVTIYETFVKRSEMGDVQTSQAEVKRVSQEIEIPEAKTKEISEIIEETMNCVVGISKIRSGGASIFNDSSVRQLGLGTGVIISENGYILTNEHVSGDKYSSCYVTLKNGEIYNGNVIWSDSDLDVAVIKINMKGLSAITLGDSDTIKIAENVYAIGNPIGVEFQRTVTAGIVSGKDRTIKIEESGSSVYMEDLIQTDATINPGNSGGPLINQNGEMIAVNSVKITSAEGIGFAIPINIIKPVLEEIVKTGKFDEAYLGIFAYDKEVIPYLDSGIEFDRGIYVAQIDKSGPARGTDLRTGDIITKIDNQQINKMSELRQYIYTKKPEDRVTLTIFRGSRQMQMELTLGKR